MRMKVRFSEKDRDKVLALIHEALGGRSLGNLVSFQMGKGFLDVVISKLGTSTLRFKESETPDALEYVLESEKIAFAHRAFKDEVKEKLVHVIKKAGGQVSVV